MPLGESPGAVTSALSYFKNRYGKHTDAWGVTVESIVIFTTLEMRESKRVSSIYNQYDKIGEKYRFEDHNVVQTVIDFVWYEIKDIMPDKGKIYWCEVFAQDYEKSFRSIAEVLLTRLAKKLMWLNLTGGTNIMNAALLQAAFLSGLVGQAYYVFVEKSYLNYLQPAGKGKFSWHPIPLIKTAFDESYHAVLLCLQILEQEWVSSVDLLSFLKADESYGRYFKDMELPRFEQDLLKKMEGWILRRQLENKKKTYDLRLTDEGKQLIDLVDSRLFKALTHRGEAPIDLPLTYRFEELWSKSTG